MNVADLAHQLVNPQQTKRRAESYHNNRRGDKSESLLLFLVDRKEIRALLDIHL